MAIGITLLNDRGAAGGGRSGAEEGIVERDGGVLAEVVDGGAGEVGADVAVGPSAGLRLLAPLVCSDTPAYWI